MLRKKQKNSRNVDYPEKNDIVVVMFDQLSAKWLEKASELGLTPNINRLQAMGTSFPNAFSSTPICMPARSSMVTGMTARQHGVLTNGYFLSPEIPTYMRILRQNGYRTGGFGKFHFYPETAREECDYRAYGFDRVEKSEDWEKWCRGGFLERNQLESPGYFFALKEEKETQTAWITRRGLDFLRESGRQSAKNRPAYAFISYVEPHPPYAPPARFLELVDPGSLPEAIEPEWTEDEGIPRQLFAARADWIPYHHYDDEVKTHPREFWLKARKYYFADIAHLDEQVGKILDFLDGRGSLHRTYVLLTADHGDLLGDHGFCEKGWAHYDACIRIPMMVSGPGLQRNRKQDEIVQLEDVFHTVLEMAGGFAFQTAQARPVKPFNLYWTDTSPPTITAAPFPRRQGSPRSMLALCTGEEGKGWRTSACIESYERTLDFWTRSIRNSRFRYTYFAGGGEQLFDLEQDVREKDNLANEPSYREVCRQLKGELLERVISQDYPPTPRNLLNPRMY